MAVYSSFENLWDFFKSEPEGMTDHAAYPGDDALIIWGVTSSGIIQTCKWN